MATTQSAVINRRTSFWRRYFAQLDGPEPERAVDMLAPDFRFSILFSQGLGDADDFSGGHAEFKEYMDQRAAGTFTHHVIEEARAVDVEFVLGEVRRGDVVLATFVAAARLDDGGRMCRYITGRSPGVAFDVAGD
jgi:hypothetical protein